MTAPTPRPKLRGRVALLFSALLGVVGVAVGVVGLVLVLNAPFAGVGDFQRVDANGTVQKVRLESGDYLAYLETPVDGSHDADLGPLRIDGEDGPVDATPYDSTRTYTDGDRNGDAKYSFTVTRSGDYDVSIKADRAPRGTTMAFGGDVADGIVPGVIMFGAGLLLVMIAVGLLVAGLVKRGRHKRELASAYRGGGNGYFNGPPLPGWGAPPPQQYGPPPGYAPPHQQQQYGPPQQY